MKIQANINPEIEELKILIQDFIKSYDKDYSYYYSGDYWTLYKEINKNIIHITYILPDKPIDIIGGIPISISELKQLTTLQIYRLVKLIPSKPAKIIS